MLSLGAVNMLSEIGAPKRTMPKEWFSVGHFEDITIRNPSWYHVPPVAQDIQSNIKDEIPHTFPGVLRHGASRRLEVMQQICIEYVRYKRTGCSPNQSYQIARKVASNRCGVTPQTVYGHINSLEIPESKSILDYLDDIFEIYANSLSKTVRIIIELSREFVDVLNVLAECEIAHPIRPSEITFEDVYQDHPDARTSVLTGTDQHHEMISSSLNDEARLFHSGQSFRSRELKNRTEGGNQYLNDSAMVHSRDITSYDTPFSRTLAEIVEIVSEKMTFVGKQKIDPIINGDDRGNDNTSIRAIIGFPSDLEFVDDYFARLGLKYWEDGSSDVSITTRPLGRDCFEKDPELTGPIEDISHAGIHTLIGYTIQTAVRNVQG